MKIGIIIGAIFGVVLLVIGVVAYFVSKKRDEKCKWCPWVSLAGICALITAGANALVYWK